jgi:hypothetical protein
MAVGDDAVAAGYTILNGSVDLVKDGDTEINRTRDWIALVKNMIQAVQSVATGGTGATTAAGARTNLGICGAITYSNLPPTGGAVGDVHFKYVP